MKVMLRTHDGGNVGGVVLGDLRPLDSAASAAIMAAMKAAGIEIAPDVIAVTLIPGEETQPERRGIIERMRLIAAMECAGWVQRHAAHILGVTARQLEHSLGVHNMVIRRPWKRQAKRGSAQP